MTHPHDDASPVAPKKQQRLRQLLNLYRILATVVGISIITLILIGVPLEHAHNVVDGLWPVGSTPQRIGKGIDAGLGIAHGFIYMGFLLVAFSLSRLAKWPVIFTLLTLVLGTVPILSFWAEHRAVRRTLAEHPGLT